MIEQIILYLIKSSLIFLIAIFVGSVLYRKNPANQSFIFRLSFLAVLFLPLLSFIAPKWFYLFSGAFSTVGQILSGGITASQLTLLGPEPVDSNQFDLRYIFPIIWIIGMVAMLLRVLIGKMRSGSISREATKLENRLLIETIDKIKNNIKIKFRVTIKLSEKVAIPFVTNIINPTIILPKNFECWNRQKQEMVLYHELAHVKRYDTLWNLISSLVVAVQWFNPLVWSCRKEMIIATEMSCDNFVVASGIDRMSYAEHLLLMTKNLKLKLFHSPVNAAMAKKNQLEGRLMSILSSKKRILKPPTSFITLVLIFSVMLVLPLSGMMPQAGEKEQQKKEQKQKEVLPGPDDFVELTLTPELDSMTSPEYPKELKKKGIEGFVWIKALVLKDGTVKKAMVLKSSGQDGFDKAATKAAYKNKFKPGYQNENPVACWVSYKVSFTLSDKK